MWVRAGGQCSGWSAGLSSPGLHDRDLAAGDDLGHARADAVLEIASELLGVARRPPSLDAVVHDEGDVGNQHAVECAHVAVALQAQVGLADLRCVAPARDRIIMSGGRRLEQLLGELGLRRAQAAADGADGNPAQLGDRLVRARAREVAQRDRRAQRRGEPLWLIPRGV